MWLNVERLVFASVNKIFISIKKKDIAKKIAKEYKKVFFLSHDFL